MEGKENSNEALEIKSEFYHFVEFMLKNISEDCDDKVCSDIIRLFNDFLCYENMEFIDNFQKNKYEQQLKLIYEELKKNPRTSDLRRLYKK